MIYLYSWQTKQYSKKCKCTDVGEASYWDSSIRLAMGIAVLGALATVATFARLIWSISHGGFTLSKVPGCWLVTGYVTGHVIGRHRVDPLFLGDFLFSWQIRWMEWGLSSCFFVFFSPFFRHDFFYRAPARVGYLNLEPCTRENDSSTTKSLRAGSRKNHACFFWRVNVIMNCPTPEGARTLVFCILLESMKVLFNILRLRLKK